MQFDPILSLKEGDHVRYSDAFCEETSTTEAGLRDCASRRGIVAKVFGEQRLCDVDWGDCFVQFDTSTPSLVREFR